MSEAVRDGYDYETFVLRELSRRGFRELRQTPRSRDYGVDLLGRFDGKEYAIQCKYYTRPVDGSAVQEAVAGAGYYGCERVMVVTNDTFTDAARRLAEANDVDLLEGIVPKPSFWDRRRPWELALLTVQCVVFGLVLREMIAQQSVTPRGLCILFLLCFPAAYLTVRLTLGILWLMRRKRS